MTSLIAPVWQELYIAALRNGDLPATAAAMVGTTQKQVDFWRTQSEEFDDACAQILEERVDALEARAYELALNGHQQTVWYKGMPVGEETMINKDLIMFMLKSSRDKFNDKLITQSKVDHNINISINSFTTSPDDPRQVIEGEYEPVKPAINSDEHPDSSDLSHRFGASAAERLPIESYT